MQSFTDNFRGILDPRLNLSELRNTSEEKEETGVLSPCSKLQLNGPHVILQKAMPPPTSGTSVRIVPPPPPLSGHVQNVPPALYIVFFKKPSVTPQD